LTETLPPSAWKSSATSAWVSGVLASHREPVPHPSLGVGRILGFSEVLEGELVPLNGGLVAGFIQGRHVEVLDELVELRVAVLEAVRDDLAELPMVADGGIRLRSRS
jgi:hypothetical protein